MSPQGGVITFQRSCELALPNVAFTQPGEEALLLHLPGRSQAAVPRGAIAMTQVRPCPLPALPPQELRTVRSSLASTLLAASIQLGTHVGERWSQFMASEPK